MYRKICILLLALVGFYPLVRAQLGVNLHANWWSGSIEQEFARSHGSEQAVGISYWFRLKKRRLEMHPEVYAYRSVATGSTAGDRSVHGGIRVPVQAYFLDWESDCMCPTFSKQGLWLKKGLFAWGAPGLQFQPAKLAGTMEGGIGFDIGAGNILTIVPMLGYGYQTSQIQLANPAGYLVTQVRFFIRWDKENFFR